MTVPDPAAVPAEDSVQALVDYLVAPLLPLRPSTAEPADPHQDLAVAKQMHAAVVLYNYYHRKQFPQLEFLGFESFCKLAVISKPSLLMYLKFMRVCKEDSADLDSQLSVTEKMVLEACQICKSLDSSRNFPNMKSWPISKIAVFLVDSAKEKCLLQFCNCTQGVWSMVEKDLDRPFLNPVGAQEMKNNISVKELSSTGLTGDKTTDIDDVLEKIALSAANENTGINQANLSILQHHTTYSLSSEKTTTRLYIMMYREVSEEFTEVPLKDVLSCLRGPLFKKNRSVEVTPVVEYYHLLPYTDFLTDYIFREAAYDGSIHTIPFVVRSETCLSESVKKPTMQDLHMHTNQTSNGRCKKTRKLEHASISNKGSEPSLPSGIANERAMDLDGLPATGLQTTTDNADCKLQTMTGGSSMGIPSTSKIMIEKTFGHIKVVGGSCNSGATGEVQKKTSYSPLDHEKPLSPHEGDSESRTDSIQGTHISTKDMTTNQAASNVSVNGFIDEAVKVDSVEKLNITECANGEPLGNILLCETAEERMHSRDLPLVPMQRTSSSRDHDILQLATVPKKKDLLQTSLQIVSKRLDELFRQQRDLQEEIAECEMNIQTISNGGEEGVGSNIDLIIEACNNLCKTQMLPSTPRVEQDIPQEIKKRKRLSEAVLSLQSPSQELDSICRVNCWMLPRYNIFPSLENGMYQANVMVHGMDFQFTVDGALKSKPREARESAAYLGLKKLRDMAECCSDQRCAVDPDQFFCD